MWLRTLFDCLKPGRSRTPVQPLRRGDRHSRRAGTCRLAVEALEDRCVPAARAFLPSLSVGSAVVAEGNSGTANAVVQVRLSAPSSQTVTVNYNTGGGTASAGSDYQAVSGKLSFAPGETSKSVQVAVVGDRIGEPDEYFFVNLGSPKNAKIAERHGIVTIVDAGVGTIIDAEPLISIGDAYNYGDYSPFTFTVSLSAPSDEVVTVDFTTVDGTAFAGVDYVFTSGTLTFAPGMTSMTITVDVLDPTYADWTNYKYFTVHLSNASTNVIIGNEGAAGWFPVDPSIAAMCQFWDCS